MLNAPRAGLQPELDAFFDHALASGLVRPPSKSALCQARRQIRPEALRDLIGVSATYFVEHSEVPLWNGYRVLALDTTVLRTPNVPECAEHFGGMNTSCGKFRPLARASALLDVARDCFVDAWLGGFDEDDRSLASHHFPMLGGRDLLVMDRGYPSRELLGTLCTQGVAFCVRMGSSWNEARRVLRSHCADQVCDLGTAEAPLRLRLLRHVLPNGKVLVVATNLHDATLNAAQFAALYRSRWRIEEVFKLIKARLQVENWSGVLPHTVAQDFYASLVRANCAAVLALDAYPQHAGLVPPEPNEKGWRVQLNCTLVLKSLRHFLPRILLAMDIDTHISLLIERLRAPSSFERTRPDRNAKRAKGVRIAGFHFAYKTA